MEMGNSWWSFKALRIPPMHETQSLRHLHPPDLISDLLLLESDKRPSLPPVRPANGLPLLSQQAIMVCVCIYILASQDGRSQLRELAAQGTVNKNGLVTIKTYRQIDVQIVLISWLVRSRRGEVTTDWGFSTAQLNRQSPEWNRL